MIFDDSILNLLHRNIHIADLDPDNELEIRFSNYIVDNIYDKNEVAIPHKKPMNYKFVPVLDRSTFNRLLNCFKTYDLCSITDNTVDHIYSVDSIRHTLCGSDSIFLCKTRTFTYDMFEYNMRLSMCKEQSITDSPTSDITLVRKKKRTSFFDEYIRYDFTEVCTFKGTESKVSKESFELEIEYIGNKDKYWSEYATVDEKRDFLVRCMVHVLCLLQDSTYVTTLSERHNVLLEYSALTGLYKTGKLFFIGAQPETLHKHHLYQLKKNYARTDKYDGERALVFVNDTGNVYFIDRRLRVKGSSLYSEKKGTLIDVENVDNTIYAFDILFNCGQDLRNDKQFTLSARLAILKSILQSFNGVIKLKEYHFGDFALKINPQSNAVPTDGFIFVPTDEPYPSRVKWSTLLKWKPKEHNTIDFMIEKNGNLWSLFVSDFNKVIPFEPKPSTMVESHISDLYNSGDIVECNWDYKKLEFVPVRERLDKNKPNFHSVALDVWHSINEPVEFSDLQTMRSSPFSQMRKFHNKVKQYIIDHAIKNSFQNRISVLDLACGRGGDLNKWNKYCNRVKYYCGIDMDKELLETACKRAETCVSFEYTFVQYDLREEMLDPEVMKTSSFDIVSCQFALHYFYKNAQTFDHYMSIVDRFIKRNGYFICTLFDGYKTFEQTLKGDIQSQDSYGFTLKTHFDKRHGIQTFKNNDYGNCISVSIEGDSDVILNSPREEYLVFADLFILNMYNRGYALKETRLFSDVPFRSDYQLDSIETIYSDLNRYYIFQKIDSRFIKDVKVQQLVCSRKKDFNVTNLYVATEAHDSIHHSLHILTGKTFELQDFNTAAEYYNMMIGILHEDTIKTYSPPTVFTRIPMVWFLYENAKYRSLCHVSEGKLSLVFPSDTFIHLDDNSKSSRTDVTESTEEISVFAPESADTDLFLGRPTDRRKGSWTVKELVELAKTRHLKVTSKKKGELLQTLIEHFSSIK